MPKRRRESGASEREEGEHHPSAKAGYVRKLIAKSYYHGPRAPKDKDEPFDFNLVHNPSKNLLEIRKQRTRTLISNMSVPRHLQQIATLKRIVQEAREEVERRGLNADAVRPEAVDLDGLVQEWNDDGGADLNNGEIIAVAELTPAEIRTKKFAGIHQKFLQVLSKKRLTKEEEKNLKVLQAAERKREASEIKHMSNEEKHQRQHTAAELHNERVREARERFAFEAEEEPSREAFLGNKFGIRSDLTNVGRIRRPPTKGLNERELMALEDVHQRNHLQYLQEEKHKEQLREMELRKKSLQNVIKKYNDRLANKRQLFDKNIKFIEKVDLRSKNFKESGYTSRAAAIAHHEETYRKFLDRLKSEYPELWSFNKKTGWKLRLLEFKGLATIHGSGVDE